jgi:probable rRNA maturation factor
MKRKPAWINVSFKGIRPDRGLSLLAGKALSSLAEKERVVFKELNVVFCGNDLIRRTNRIFRKKDRVTDVISFYYDVSDRKNLYGDIMISVERAKEQAADYGNTHKSEVLVLLVHGFYHALGLDHKRNADHRKMKDKEDKALAFLQGCRNGLSGR